MKLHGYGGWTTRRIITLALAAAGISQPLAGYGKTFYLVTCKPENADVASIQRAVTGVPPGATINVCPGTYSGHGTIQQRLTLQDIQSRGNANVIIGDSVRTLYTVLTSALEVARWGCTFFSAISV
jgi:hypothetical protein